MSMSFRIPPCISGATKVADRTSRGNSEDYGTREKFLRGEFWPIRSADWEARGNYRETPGETNGRPWSTSRIAVIRSWAAERLMT